MPKIHSSADLRNNYNDISKFCHEYNEPVFITKNGKGDLAVMSIDAYEELVAWMMYNLAGLFLLMILLISYVLAEHITEAYDVLSCSGD